MVSTRNERSMSAARLEALFFSFDELAGLVILYL